jgi:predicted PhzF superfamily epimerase YddE/YHI9
MSALPRLEYHLINAFTTTSPHSGNQASVVIFPKSDPRAEDDAFLLRTAKDFGFSETAYLVPIDEEKGRWGLRWFTVQVVCPLPPKFTQTSDLVSVDRIGSPHLRPCNSCSF